MKLHTNSASPYGRKVKVAAMELGLFERIELATRVLTVVQPSQEVNADNPLGKIPCLVTDDGMPLYDSRVIVEYLDSLHDGPKLIPQEPERKWPIMRLQALGDGILDAALLRRYEIFLRPEEKQWDEWVVGHKAKMTRALDSVEQRAENYGDMLCVGTITLACALGYIDFRMPEDGWRSGRPRLASWYDQFSQRESMRATEPS